MASSCARRGSGCILEKKLFSEKVVRGRHRLPGEVVESLSLEIFNKRVDVALRDMA